MIVKFGVVPISIWTHLLFFFLPLHGGKVLPNSTPMLLYSTKKKENDGMIVCRDIDTIN